MEKSASKPTTCKSTRSKEANLTPLSHKMQMKRNSCARFQKYLEGGTVATSLFFPFSFLSWLLPSNPQCSRQCPSLLAPARGRPGSSMRPAWERRSPSSPQVPTSPASDPSGCSQPCGLLGGLSHLPSPGPGTGLGCVGRRSDKQTGSLPRAHNLEG